MNTIPMSNVRAFYASAVPDGHWFSPSAMRFFKCRLPRVAYKGKTGAYFVTSEEGFDNDRRYSVRFQDAKTGLIETVGEFHSYLSREAAVAAIRELLASESTV